MKIGFFRFMVFLSHGRFVLSNVGHVASGSG
jgi:hypothetical protein